MDRELDLMYERYTDRLIRNYFGDDPGPTDDWDENAEDRAVDKWRGFGD